MADGSRAGAVTPLRDVALLALVCLGVVGLLYYRSLGLGLVGDDIGFVHPPPDWFQHLLRPSGAWHFYPLNTLVFAVLGILTGRQPAPLHLIEMVTHAAVGVGLALWLARFGLHLGVRLLVAVFFVSRGVHYEVVAWITELSYVSVALYTLVTLACWDRYLRGHGRRFLAATAAAFAAALFTIEHALLIAPICFCYDALLGGPVADAGSTQAGLRPRWTRRAWRTLAVDAIKYAPFVLVVATFLGLKQMQQVGLTWSLVASSTPPPPVASGIDVVHILPPERTWLGMLNTPLRAYLDLLSATTWLFLPSSLAFSAEDGVLTRLPWVFLIPWLAVQVAILWKGSPLARFLLVWIYVYELPLAAGSVPQARYHYMASMPASALVGLGVAALGRRTPAGRRTAIAAAAAGLLAALVFVESRFIGARLDEWKVASDLVRTTVADVQRQVSPTTRDLYLVNMPRAVPGAFWPAYAFGNLAEHLPLLFQPPRTDLRTHVVYDRSFVDDRWPTIGSYLPREEIGRRAASPDAAVFEFVGPPHRVVPVR